MSRLFDDASSQFLDVGSVAIAGYPLTMACWFWCDDTARSQALVSLANSSSHARLELNLAGNLPYPPPLIAFASDGSSYGYASSSIPYPTNQWAHACAVFTSSTSRTIYLDGGNSGSNTASAPFPGGMNTTSIGRQKTLAVGSYMSGKIAEAAIWDVALTAGEALELARGKIPYLVRPASLVSYWKLLGRTSPEIDIIGRYELAVTGATASDHPRVIGHSKIILGKPTSGSIYNESGSGGMILGGSGLVLANYSPTISGGVSLGGSSSGVSTYNPAAAGGVTLGGQSIEIASYVPTASGGVSLGGTSAVSASYVITSSGGVVIGGSASPESSTYSEVGSGGIIVGGSSTVAAIYTPEAAGGVSLSGFASITVTYVLIGSGGVVTGGYGVITTPLQIVNLVYGRPLEITRITGIIPIRSLSIELSRITTIEVLQMSLTIPQATKTTSDNLTYTFDLRRISFLQNDPITGTPTVAQLSGTGSLTFTTPEVSGELVTVGIGGGTAGQTYRVGLLVTTVNGRTIDGLVDIRVVSRTSSG